MKTFVSAKGLAGVIFVGIAIAAVGLSTVETSANVQWFTAVDGLSLKVSDVTFRLDVSSPTAPYVRLEASIANPAGYKIPLYGANYIVFVNSTSEEFTMAGSSEVSNGNRGLQGYIATNGNLNLTANFSILSDLVAPPNYYLQGFLNRHNQTDLVMFVGITLYLSSAYGSYNVVFCHQLPGDSATICPSPRTPTGGGFGGG